MKSRDPFGPEKGYLSVSQLKQYERCPYSYYLSRIKKVWQRPAAWLPQGTAVHAAIEAWEWSGRKMSLEEAQAVFAEEYRKEVNRYAETTPNFQWWFASGPYKGMEDISRRREIGLDQVRKYVEYATRAENEVIWITPDGTPAIELGFDIELDGVLIRGFIDAVVEVYHEGEPWPEHRVRDHKTGNNPGDDFQLGVYAVALADKFGLSQIKTGDYWMGRSGKPTYPFDLRDWTPNTVAEKFKELESNIEAERFDPDPDPDKCRFCDVSYACEYKV
jgi:putative RecB family exonuclease